MNNVAKVTQDGYALRRFYEFLLEDTRMLCPKTISHLMQSAPLFDICDRRQKGIINVGEARSASIMTLVPGLLFSPVDNVFSSFIFHFCFLGWVVSVWLEEFAHCRFQCPP